MKKKKKGAEKGETKSPDYEDHSVLVSEFAEIIRRTPPIVNGGIVMGKEVDAALLFLEASAWNVKEAMDSYLAGRGGSGEQKATAAGGRSALPASDFDELGDDIRWMEGPSAAVAAKKHSDPSLAAELRNLRVQTFGAEKDEADAAEENEEDADEEDEAGEESGEGGKVEGGEEDKLSEERTEEGEQKGEEGGVLSPAPEQTRIKATEDEKKGGDANQGKRGEDDDGQQVGELSPILVRGVLSDDTACQLEAMTQIRKLLCTCGCNPSIDAERIMGLAPRFVELLQRPCQRLQREAAHALGYITGGTRAQTREVVELNTIPILVQLLGGSTHAGVLQEVAENLSYIAQTSSEYRDLLLESNVLQPLLEQINNEDPTREVLQFASLALAALCHHDPSPEFETVAPALDTLLHLLSSSDDTDILANTCEALASLCEGHADKMQTVIEDDVCRRLVELLTHPSPGVQSPALRAVGHLVFLEGTQRRQEALDGSILPCLPSLLSSSDHDIAKTACWMCVKESYCITLLTPQPGMLRLQLDPILESAQSHARARLRFVPHVPQKY